MEGTLHLPASIDSCPQAKTIAAQGVPKAPKESFLDLHVAFITLRKRMEIIWRLNNVAEINIFNNQVNK